MSSRQLLIDVPEAVLLAEKTDEVSFARELRMLAAVKLYELGRLSPGPLGRFCEGLSRAAKVNPVNLDLTIYLTREGRQYVAHAMPLDVVSSGPTPEAAREAVYEAVRAFLLTAADQGTLEEVLEDCGYERRTAGLSRDEFFQLLEDL